MLKLWVWIYKVTGWYSPFAELAEYRAVRAWFDKYACKERQYELDIVIGMWQAKNGFTRKVKM